MEQPYTERYVRWCERSGVNHPLLLDFPKRVMNGLLYLYTIEGEYLLVLQRNAEPSTG